MALIGIIKQLTPGEFTEHDPLVDDISVQTVRAVLLTRDAGNLSLSTTTSGNIVVGAVGNLQVTGQAIQIDGTAVSHLTVTGASLTVNAVGAAANVVMSAGQNLDLDGALLATLNAPTINIGATTGGATLTATTGDIVIATTDVAAAGDVTVGPANGSAGGELVLRDGRVGTMALSSGVENTYTGSATTLIGRLNEALSASSQSTVDVVYDAGVGGITKCQPCYVSSNDTVLPANATATPTHRVVGIAIADTPAGDPVTVRRSGKLDGFDFLLGTAGQPVFLDTTAGSVSTTAPNTAGSYVVRLGFIANDGGGVAGSGVLDIMIQEFARNS